jgi:ABC-type multidrug transport system fused ATPase/permease subunit
MNEINTIPESKSEIAKSKNNLKNSIYKEFHLDKIGSIEYAKIHSKANRPLHKIKDAEFNKETIFCRCCNLPVEQKNILEKFSFYDNPDQYVECGEGISLYFKFFQISIITIAIIVILFGYLDLIFVGKYTNELRSICNNSSINHIIFKDCQYFIELHNNSGFNYRVNSHFFSFNNINVKYYRKIFYKLTSINNKNIDKVIVNTSYINFLCLITLFIFNLLYIVYFKIKCQLLNRSLLSLSDYSVFLTNLNSVLKRFLQIKKEIEEKKNNNLEYANELNDKLGIDKSKIELNEFEQFIDFLKNKICVLNNGERLNIKKINICFKISQLMYFEENYNKIKEKISKIKNHPYQIRKNQKLNLFEDDRKYFNSYLEFFDLHYCEKEEELKELKDKESNLSEEMDYLFKRSRDNTLNYFAGCAIICLDSIKEQEQFLENNSNNLLLYLITFFEYIFCRCCMNKNKKENFLFKGNIGFHRAPEPEDILFENLEYTNSIYKLVRIIFVYFISIILISICFLIVTYLNYLQKYIDEKKNSHIIQSYIISLMISCCILIIKLSLFSFINSGIVPLMSELFNKTEEYEYLVNNMFSIFLVNATITPILWTLNFSFIYKKIRIFLTERKKKFKDYYHGKTQRELNELYELPSMNIAEKYSYIYKTILITFFYMPIFPFGTIISLFGLTFGYFLEKFNFCNMYQRPEMINDQLCKGYIDYFILALFLNGIGDYIFKKDVYETRLWSVLNITIFGILILMPYKYIINYFIKYKYNIYLKESYIHKSCLNDVYFSFFNDYERANPMTKKEGIKNYLDGLKDKGIISDSIYQENIDNLQNINLMHLYYNESKNRNILKAKKTYMKNEKNKYNLITRTMTVNNESKDEYIEKYLRTKHKIEIKNDYLTVLKPSERKDLFSSKESIIIYNYKGKK